MALENITTILITLGICVLAIAVGFWLKRKKKSAAELERERRLAINAIGRLTEGLLMEGDCPDSDSPNAHLLFYRYRAAGVDYSAAQDITSLRHVIPAKNCVPGRAATVKYDPHNPSNSILVCELWSGLPDAARNADNIRPSPSLPQRETTLAN
ncbi:MAG: LPXTG cell wall anchor domain-containing protein [Acidobacteria bacterium]|nr:LPXTG cell wall anchor domain-containing protein [Acidobacteriota bacterium]